MSDILTRATEALRAETAAADPMIANATRLRVRRSLEERARGRRRLAIVGALSAFLFGGTTAWAIATGELPAVWRAVHVEPAAAPIATAPPAPPARHVRDGRAEPAAADHTVAIAEPPPATRGVAPTPARDVAPTPAVGDAVSPTTRTIRRLPDTRATTRSAVTATPTPHAPPAPAPATAAATPERAPTPTEALYRRAHAAHFRGGDLAAALAAWDAYLAAEPDGRFAVEARYNRALVLARLGRYRDAHAALAPFARGEIAGGYRRDDAAALVARLAELARD